MEIAGQRTKRDHPLVIEEQGLASPLCHHAHRQHRGPGAGIGLAKELPFLYMIYVFLMSPEILLDNACLPPQQNQHLIDGFSHAENVFPILIKHLLRGTAF